jgi:histidinol-phosphatase (PHP family)
MRHHSPAAMDLHVHSDCSADGLSSITEYAQRAGMLGLAMVGFCEHVDLDPRDQDYGFLDAQRYEQEIESSRRQAPRVQLRKGVEIAYQSSRHDEIRSWLDHGTYDYVMLSVHLVDYADGWAIVSEPSTTGAYFSQHSARQSYLPYFEELLRAAKSGLGHVLGHFDLVKRHGVHHYGAFDPTDFEDDIRSVLATAVKQDVGLEINTSGLRQSPREPYPHPTVLRWYRELGGEILTIGSDAHHVDDLGTGLADALSLAQMAGFRAIATFEQGQARWVDL